MVSEAVPLRPLAAAASQSSETAHSDPAFMPDPDPAPIPSSSSTPSAARHDAAPTPASKRLNTAFFLFGLLNNSLYVVILTAALELLPQGVPTGLVSFTNIFPALIAKAVWPYLLKGKVRYTKRVWSCAALSFVGMILISLFPSLWVRLLGISLASFSSGLGELTFLQLSTRYAPKEIPKPTQLGERNFAGDGVGWFASGTGAAGLVGAAAWWIVRPLGVQLGLGILSLLPGLMVGAYVLILPSVEKLLGQTGRGAYEAVPTIDQTPSHQDGRPKDDDEDDEESDAESIMELAASPITLASSESPGHHAQIRLSFQDKMTLLKPMLWPYIFPLVTVYFAEYTINQGVAPTLVYPLPTHKQHPLLSLIIRKLSDYYPLYQLVYQTFVFISRSSISILHLPAIPKQYLWAPAVLQTGLLLLLTSESLHAWFRSSIAIPLVIVLICIEGLAGGGAYVSVFYQIGLESTGGSQEHEFRIGCVGFGDSLGILAASIVSMPLQVGLCSAAAKAGRDLCKQL